MSQTKHQTFETRLMKRSEIQAAPYNPRTISAYNRSILQAKIKEIGLVEPLVWNQRTGNLVSGHQRLSILDELEQRDDYELTMAVVDLDPVREKEAVVFLNNPTGQGVWDEDALAELLKHPDVSLEGMGWTSSDLQIEFPDLELPESMQPAEGDGIVADQEAAVAGSVDEFAAIKEARKAGREEARADIVNDADYMLLVAFRTNADRNQFLRVNGMASGVTHMTADELATLLKPEHLWRTETAAPEAPGPDAESTSS